MKNIKVHYLLRLAVFWLLFFAMFRMLFIVYHHAKIPDGQHSETSLSFFYAVPLDLSIVALMLIVPYILWSIQQFYKSRLLHRLNQAYHFTLIVLVSALSIFNIKIYGEYETLLTTEELAYLLYPKEAVTFLSLWSLLLLLAASGLFALIGIRVYRRYISNFSYPVENMKLKKLLVAGIPFVLIASYFCGYRTEPVERSPVEYSHYQVNNDIATNTIWFLGHSFCKGTPLPE